MPDDVATRLLDRFTEVGLIDDGAFARAWVDSRMTGKGLAGRSLAIELRRKGIDDDLAREVLDAIEPDDEEAAARRVVRSKLRSVRRLEPEVQSRRLFGVLARKGYPPGVAVRIVREELAAAPVSAD